MKKIVVIILFILCPLLLAAAQIEGTFLILSTPYNADGSVNYANLVKEARFAANGRRPV